MSDTKQQWCGLDRFHASHHTRTRATKPLGRPALGGRRLIGELRELYPDVPVVLTAPGMLLDWVETEGAHKVTPYVGVPTAARLDAAIREALGEADEPAGAAART